MATTRNVVAMADNTQRCGDGQQHDTAVMANNSQHYGNGR
jgi:hypothetical protein